MSTRLMLLLTLTLFSASCVHTNNITKVPQNKFNKVAIISLFTDEVKGSRGIGLGSTKVYSADSCWKINDYVGKIIEKNLNKNVNSIYKVDFDMKSFSEDDEKKYNSLAQAIVANYNIQNEKSDFDVFIVMYPNAIDERGNKYSALMNFGLMGPIGLLIGEKARRDGAFTPIMNFYVPNGFENVMGEKPRCLLGYNLFVIGKDLQIIGQKENILSNKTLTSEIWPEDESEFDKLNLTDLKQQCMDGLSQAVEKSLMDVGLNSYRKKNAQMAEQGT